MSRLSTCVRMFILIPALAIFSPAQEQPLTETEQAKNKQAFEFLETIAEGISGLRSADNRIYLASTSADLLWEKDEKRARALFDTVTKEMVAAISAIDILDQDNYHHNNTIGFIQQQRREIIERMGRRDPKMALAFLRATRLPSDANPTHDHGEAELELQLAGMISEEDPAQALRTARASIQKRISYSIGHVINRLENKDPAAAQALYRDVINRLKSEDLSRNFEVASVAWNLLGSYQPPQAKEENFRELLELLATAVLSIKLDDPGNNNLAHNHYYSAQSLIGQLEKHTPGLVPALRNWQQNVLRTLDPGSRMHQELNEIAQNGTVDAVLAFANNHRPEFQAQIYERAAWKAMNDGDINRARQIISDYVKNPAQRRSLLQQMEQQSVWNRISQNKLSEARDILARVKNIEQRVQMLLSMAATVSNAGDQKQALDLLDEAKRLLDSQPTDANKMTIRLQLAQRYSKLDFEQSAALIESVIMRINELVAAAAVLDGFEQRYLKDGEWTKTHYSAIGNVINNIDQSLGELARVDLKTAQRLSNLLERPEIRLMAKMAIVQALMRDSHQTSPINRRHFQPIHGRHVHVINAYPMH